jgi:hypothetical protein
VTKDAPFIDTETFFDDIPRQNGTGPKRPLNYRYLDEIVANPIAPPPMLIHGLCRQGEVGIMTGPANRLKSRTAAELWFAIGAGLPAFGHFAIAQQGPALMIQNEIHPGVYDERMLRYKDRTDQHQNLILISREDFHIDPEGMALLNKVIEAVTPILIILDPVSEMWPRERDFDENNPHHMTQVLERLKAVRDRDITVIYVHHDPKDSERRARGSQRLIDAPDLRVYLSKANKKGGEVMRAKVHVESRTVLPPNDFDVTLGHDGRLHYEEMSLTAEQDDTLDVISRLVDPTTTKIAEALGIEWHAADGRLSRLQQAGKVTATGKPKVWRIS